MTGRFFMARTIGLGIHPNQQITKSHPMSSKSLLQIIYDNRDDLYPSVLSSIKKGADVNAVTQYAESALKVASGNGRFDVVRLLLESGADATQLEWTPVFYAIAFDEVEDVRNAIGHQDDLEKRDSWYRTPLLLAILTGNRAKASLLLELGANRNAVGLCGKTPFQYAVQNNDIGMLGWLYQNGFDPEASDMFLTTPLIDAAKQGMTESVSFLLSLGVNIHTCNDIPERAIEVASNLEIVHLLLARGEDINSINEETHALLIGTRINGQPNVQQDIYEEHKHPRFGRHNPEKCTNAFWLDMIRTGASAWTARESYHDDSSNCPIWSYQRYGRSTNLLKNGVIIEIAGEHEDHYDPDFCIYNDVTVFHPNGDIEIYGYPENIFPCTDFHSATLIGKHIIIIGNLGYPESRIVCETPVYALDIESMKIKKISTSGNSPGWISQHHASFTNGILSITGGNIWTNEQGAFKLLENERSYQLCIENWTWK